MESINEKKFFYILSQKNDTWLQASVKEEQIIKFEKENNISLPILYREWLKISDGGEILGSTIQLCGINNKPLIFKSVEMECSNYWVIGISCDGDQICFKSNEQSIFIRGEVPYCFINFIEFIKNIEKIYGD